MRSLILPIAITASCSTVAAEKRDEVVVVGHYETAIGTSDAASAGAVTAKLIANRPALRPCEMLEFVPGVIVTQHSGDGKANQYFLRGFNLDHGTDFATSVAGMPVNMRTHVHGQGYTDLNFLIPELIERIDYTKGPYYAELGDFANAGAAQMSLFNALPRGIASLTIGENNFVRALIADSIAFSDGSVLFGFEGVRNNGPWDEPEKFRKTNGVLRYSTFDKHGTFDKHDTYDKHGTFDKPGTLDKRSSASESGDEKHSGFSVTAMLYSARWNSTDQIPERAVAANSIDRFDTIDDSDGGETHRYSISLEGARSDSAGRSEVTLYAVKSDLNLFSNFTYYLDDPINGDQFEQAERRTLLGFDTSRTWFGHIGERRSDSRLGVQGRYDDLDPVALYTTVARERIGTTRRDEVEESSIGVHATNTTHWTRWLRSVLGVRFDAYAFDVVSDLAENSGGDDDSIVSPKLSLIFGPWARTEFFVNYGEGFHSNDARGTTQQFSPRENIAVDPVTPLTKSRGAEIGMRSEFIPRLQSSLALWQLKLDSELVFIGDAGDTTATRASKRYGIEWNNHYVANDWLLFDLDLSASHARFTQGDVAGNYIPGAVDRVASAGITLSELGPWYAQLQLRYFGPRPLVEDNSVRSNSTVLAYLRGGYRIDNDWKATIDVFNLFDRAVSDIDYYYTSRLPGEASDGLDDRHFHPVEPRTVRLSIIRNY